MPFLIVDKDNDIATAIQMILEGVEEKALVKTNSQSVLDALLTQSQQYQGVFLDTDMDDAAAFIRALRSVNPHIPLTVIDTATVFTKEEALSLGAAGYIEKPFAQEDIEEVLQIMKEHVTTS